MLFKNQWLYREKDGGGSGGSQDPPKSDPPKPDPKTGDGPGDPDGDPNSGEVNFTSEQQKAIDKVIAERLKREREKWASAADEAKKKAEEEAEKARLKEQEKWQELAEAAEKKVAELEPVAKSTAEQLKAYQETVNALLDAKIKELGDKAKVAVEALPGEPDALAKLNWLTANAALFGEEGTPLGTPPRTPRRQPKQPADRGDDPPWKPRIKM